MPRLALAVLLAAAATTLGAVPALAAPAAPSLSVDTFFAPTTGVGVFDFTSGTASDVPNGIAVDAGLGRIYTVGEVRDASGDANIGIVARKTDGTLVPDFGQGGKVVKQIAPGTGRDLGSAIVVLPDHKLRILGGTDGDATSVTNIDAAIVGLNADGTTDTDFGAGDGTPGDGLVKFAVGTGDDSANRMVVDDAGRLAISGSTKVSGADDSFVSLREPDGSPTPGFGAPARTDGVVVLNRAGGALTDRAIDVAFRPGGGILAALQVSTAASPAPAPITALHAFTATGADDPTFAGTGDLVVSAGDSDTVPGALMAAGDKLYLTGSTKVAVDTDAYVARLNADGSGLESRRFDMRGVAVDDTQAVSSQGLDLVMVPGIAPTLVVVGSMTSPRGTGWAGAAFNNLDGPLADAGYGDEVFPNPGQGGLIGAAVLGDDQLAVAGSILNTSSLDTSFGHAKVLVDRDKSCDLALSVPRPLEIVFRGSQAVKVQLRAKNNGTKACRGTITVPDQYALSAGGVPAPLTTGVVEAGSTVDLPIADLAYHGPRLREATLPFSLASARDIRTANNTANVHVVFSYCDLALRPTGHMGTAPTEGSRDYGFTVRNVGTAACRAVSVGVARGGRRTGGEAPFRLDAGRSASTEIAAALSRAGAPGTQAAITFRAGATADVNPANDRATLRPRLVRVGDSAIRRAGARGFAGSASGGRGPLTARQLRVQRVEVAVRRLGGKGCTWLAGTRLQTLKASKGRCTRMLWLRAAGTRSWSVRLRSALPAGRYEVRSRAVIGSGFAEGSFSRADRNLVAFRVR